MNTTTQTPSERKGFTFYRSFAESISLLPDSDKLVIYEAITRYALDGVEPDVEAFSPFAQLLWTALKPNFEADRRRYENGTRGGAPKGNSNASKQPKNNQETTEKQPKNNQETSNVNENVNVKVNEKEKENVKGEGVVATAPHQGVRFTPPSLKEIRDYISERGYKDIDPRRFADYYASTGWRVGNSPMHDWRAALRRWHNDNKQTTNNLKETKYYGSKTTSADNGCAPRLFRNLGDDDYLGDA